MSMSEPTWENGTAKEYLDELGGSKSGAYQYLCDAHPELRKHLPTGSRYLPPGGDVENFLKKLDMSKRKIVRGCHPLDVHGMVDVIYTAVDQRDIRQVRDAIRKILDVAQDPKVHSYMEYESGKPFDGKVGILVQNYYGTERGSIIEHPHEKGTYRVEYVNPSITSKEIVDTYIADETGKAFDVWVARLAPKTEKLYKNRQDLEPSRMQQIIALYRNIQETGLMPSTHSFQMEYGATSNDIMFYQARLFRPYERQAEFSVKVDLRNKDPEGLTSAVTPYNVFGITPEQGIEFKVVDLTTDVVEEQKGNESLAYRHGAYFHHHSLGLQVQPRNMQAYMPTDESLLEHGHFRWMQKSPLTLGGIRGDDEITRIREVTDDIRVRLCSNGVRGGYSFIMPEKKRRAKR